jgi:CheY-like chemotaxis protein
MADQKVSRERMRSAIELAESANRAKSEFLANMSHEIRTPISAILGYSDILLDPELNPQQHDRSLRAIRHNAEHLLQLINDILDFSKIEAGKLDVEFTGTSPWQIVTDVCSSLRVRADEKQIRLITEAEGKVPMMILSDPTRLRQILFNLVSNALKFSEKGSRVLVQLGAEEPVDQKSGSIYFCVIDEGIGMTEEQASKLFVPFQQVDSSSSRRAGGTGLGLTICRRLTELLGGEIQLSSRAGEGSTFVFRLPVDTNNSKNWVPAKNLGNISFYYSPTEDKSPLTCLSGRVLVAEDNPDNYKIISHHLAKAGLKLEWAENGKIALEMAIAKNYDVVLMDMQMPEIDGYEATKRLRAAGYAKPIIALTAHAMRGDREKCLSAGCSNYLTKPIKVDDLIATIRKYMLEASIKSNAGGQNESKSECDLIAEYARRLPRRILELSELVEKQDLRQLSAEAHKLKGSAGLYGFSNLGELAGLIEAASNENQPQELLLELVRELESCIETQNNPEN